MTSDSEECKGYHKDCSRCNPQVEAQSEAPSVDTTSLEQKITKLTLEIASKQKVISRLKAGTNVCQDCGRVLTRCENCERLWQT